MAQKVNYDYLGRVRAMVNLYTSRKTSNVLEGGFRSVFMGRSLEFNDLKEYDYGDNVHDIDWKSSSRTGKTLVRRYMAEKKHNVLFVADAGPKMTAHTVDLEMKDELALLTFGSIAYLADRQGADFSLAWSGGKGPKFHYFRSGASYLETLLYEYRSEIGVQGSMTVNQVLSQAVDQINKRMVIFVITDLPGAYSIDEKLARKVTLGSDLLVLCIEDAYYFGNKLYDVGRGRYENAFFISSKKLKMQEEALRAKMLEHVRHVFRRSRVNLALLSKQDQILDRTVELFYRHRNGIYG